MQKYCLSRPIKNKQGNRSIIGIGKSDWPGADYTKEPWGQSKRFANGYDGRGGQYEAMDMLILGQHRAMDMMERGERVNQNVPPEWTHNYDLQLLMTRHLLSHSSTL